MHDNIINFKPRPNLVLHYDSELNVMRDMNEYIIFNIFGRVTPNELYLFKKNKKTMVVMGVQGNPVTLLWVD